MSVLNTADSMISIATTEAQAAGLILQPAIMIGFEFQLSTGKAAGVDKAGQQWRTAADQVGQAIAELQQAVAGISAQDWTADDRTAYEQQVQAACAQLETVQAFLEAAGIALSVFGYALMAYAVFALAMGTGLGVLAALAAAALAGVVTAELYAEFEEAAGICLTITTVATAILACVSEVVAMVLQGGALLDATVETHQGNDKAFGDLVQAEEVGSAAALANLAQNGINAGLAYAGRTNGIGVHGGTRNNSGFSGIDLDADRDKDHTWNVGGAATYDDVTAGGHVKWGDQGFQGGDATVGYTKDGASVSLNGGGYKDADGNWHVTGGGSAGYEQVTTGTNGTPSPSTSNGWGVKDEANFDWNTGNGQVDGNGSVSVTNHGADMWKGSDSVTHDANGNVVQTPEVDTPYGDWRNGKYFV